MHLILKADGIALYSLFDLPIAIDGMTETQLDL